MAHERGIGRGRVDRKGGHDSDYEVDRSKARRNRRGEAERVDPENTLPLVGRVSGQVRFYSLLSFHCSWSSGLRGARLSSAPPPPFLVKPYVSRYPPDQREGIFVVVLLALSL